MATTTPNFGLTKPALSEPADIEVINGNMNLIDSLAKKKQTAKTSPNASGTDISFINSVSQAEDGVITATKATVRNAGRNAAGLITLPSGSTTNRYLREDGTWQRTPDTNTWRMYTTKTYTCSGLGIQGNAYVGIKASQFSPTVETPAGYEPVAIRSVNTGDKDLMLIGANATATPANSADMVVIRNLSNTGTTISVSISILYLQQNLA